jgi:glucose dehydrogenase
MSAVGLLEFKAKGVITGTENYGGAVVTAGGVFVFAATRDGKFRAFSMKTGKHFGKIYRHLFATPPLIR